MNQNAPASPKLLSSFHAIIMAGGGGTRFWPRSRQKFPKQFLKLAGDRTLLQQAFDRIESLSGANRTWVITSASHQRLVGEQLSTVPKDRIVGEPCGRDTAACIGLGAALIAAQDPNAIMAAMPADHVIEPEQEFRRALQAAIQVVESHPAALVTFGIPPTYPAIGYGYIHRGKDIGERQGVMSFQVQTFKEKPDAATAERYVHSGEFLWNSGIFVWKVATLLNELRRQHNEVHAAVSRIADAWPTPRRDEVFRNEYEPLKKLSIDYAVMEHAQQVLVLQTPFRWDDVGSWQAIERMNPQDAAGNTVLATHAGLQTEDCLIVADSDRLVATVGVNNLIIVQDGDATLVADKRDEGAIKKLVEHLKQTGWEKFL